MPLILPFLLFDPHSLAIIANMTTNFLQPPRLRVGEDTEEERRATWLELFYDLVFVVAISQLAHNLFGICGCHFSTGS